MADTLFPSDTVAERLGILAVLAEMHHIRPGRIEAFDPASNLAEAQVAVKSKFFQRGAVEYVDPPVILRVPVVVPYSPFAGVCVTVPVRKGDPCLLLFSDRFIDNFVEEFAKGEKPVYPEAQGADNASAEPRLCHMTDAICIPGLYGQPDTIPNWNNDAVEMRTHDGKNYVRIGGGDYGLRMTTGGGFDAGGADIRMKDGKMWLYAQEFITRAGERWTEEPPTSTGGTREPTMPE